MINWIYTTRLNDINVDYSVRNYEDHSTESVSAHKNLKALRRTNTNRIIIGHLNINSIRNKFDDSRNLITQNVDILLISETKLDASFPPKQFYLENYSPPYRLDRSINGGGLILYIREDIPSKEIKTTFTKEGLFIEINLKKQRWLLFGGYNPNKSSINEYLFELSTQLDTLLSYYENFIIMGNFNSELTETNMAEFCDTYDLTNLIREPTCYKNPNNPLAN